MVYMLYVLRVTQTTDENSKTHRYV